MLFLLEQAVVLVVQVLPERHCQLVRPVIQTILEQPVVRILVHQSAQDPIVASLPLLVDAVQHPHVNTLMRLVVRKGVAALPQGVIRILLALIELMELPAPTVQSAEVISVQQVGVVRVRQTPILVVEASLAVTLTHV